MGSVPLRSPHERQSTSYRWIKSSLSYANGNCVEVANLPGAQVGVRNSRDVAGPVLEFTSQRWRTFLDSVRNGEFGGAGP